MHVADAGMLQKLLQTETGCPHIIVAWTDNPVSGRLTIRYQGFQPTDYSKGVVDTLRVVGYVVTEQE